MCQLRGYLKEGQILKFTRFPERIIITILVAALVTSFVSNVVPSLAYTTSLYAYKTKVTPTIDGQVSEGEWDDAPFFNETLTGLTIALKHNSSVIFMVLSYAKNVSSDDDYIRLEFDNNGDGAHMGSIVNPDDAVLISPSFKPNNAKDVFVKGFAEPTYDEQAGGINNWEGKMTFSNGKYVAEIKRTFFTEDTGGQDASFQIETTLGIGLAVGRFGYGVSHKATNMATYSFTIKDSQYVPIQEKPLLDPILLILTILLISVSAFAIVVFLKKKNAKGKELSR